MVLQRWQTVYLLIAVILMIVTNFVPVMTIGDATGVVDVTFANELGPESSQMGMTAYIVVEVALGALAVPFAIICTFLARAGVKKDRDLLKSVEHFR